MPRTLKYTETLRAVEGRVVEALPEIIDALIDRAKAGHIAYIRLLLDLVDGKIRPTAEEETTGGVDCVLIVSDEEREAETVRAA
jgi:hypothetical protein